MPNRAISAPAKLRRRRVGWKLIGFLLAVAAIVVGTGVYWIENPVAPVRYAMAAVTRGNVTTTISASGTVNPVVVVAVGTYVSGTIVTLSCDYNTKVHKGQLCAKIDSRPYQIIVDQNQAELDVAKAQRAKDQANLAYTKINHQRLDLLLSRKLDLPRCGRRGAERL